MQEGFNATKMKTLASQSNYYMKKIEIAASKGKYEKIFKGSSWLYKGLQNELEPLGFSVRARYNRNGDIEYIDVSWK